MEANIQNSINIANAFSCRLCKKVALEPLQNQCCAIIVCDTCTNPTCYHCKKPCTYLKSFFLEHLYKCISIKCPYKCKTELTLFALKAHKAVCPEATMECVFCKDKNIKTIYFPEHMGNKHEEECSRLLIEFHKVKEAVKNEVVANNQFKISPFRVGLTGVPRLCKFGRLVCGSELGIPNRGSGIFNARPTCSVEFGSCGKCMGLDKQRLALPQNCLLNIEGRICYYSPQRKKVACGILVGIFNKNMPCNGVNSCSACVATLQLVIQEVYRLQISSQ